MKRNLSLRLLALSISPLLGSLPLQAAERPFAFSGSGTATFITDAAGNVTGANVTASGTATYILVYGPPLGPSISPPTRTTPVAS